MYHISAGSVPVVSSGVSSPPHIRALVVPYLNYLYLYCCISYNTVGRKKSRICRNAFPGKYEFSEKEKSVCLKKKNNILENEKRILAKRNVIAFLYASEVLQYRKTE